MIDVKMYGASWCNPCKQTKPQFFKAADDYDGDQEISWDYLDVDDLPVDVLLEENIRSVPVIRVYLDGSPIGDVASRIAPSISAEVDHLIYMAVYHNDTE